MGRLGALAVLISLGCGGNTLFIYKGTLTVDGRTSVGATVTVTNAMKATEYAFLLEGTSYVAAIQGQTLTFDPGQAVSVMSDAGSFMSTLQAGTGTLTPDMLTLTLTRDTDTLTFTGNRQ
jgi:hypothetical protein